MKTPLPFFLDTSNSALLRIALVLSLILNIPLASIAEIGGPSLFIEFPENPETSKRNNGDSNPGSAGIDCDIPHFDELTLRQSRQAGAKKVFSGGEAFDWKVELSDSAGKGLTLHISIDKNPPEDPLYSSFTPPVSILLTDIASGQTLASCQASNIPSTDYDTAIWQLRREGNQWHLFGGSRGTEHLVSFRYPEFDLQSIILHPESPTLKIRSLLLRGAMDSQSQYRREDPSGVEALSNSVPLPEGSGDLTGVWGILDRSFDTEKLDLGGDYRLSILPEENRWIMRYLSGADINPSDWREGDLKCILEPTGFPDIYDTTWIDAEKTPISREIKCVFDPESSLLTITFPHRNSTLRLRRLRNDIPTI